MTISNLSGKSVSAFRRHISKAALLMMAVAPAALLIGAGHVSAATDTWVGGGTDNNWKTGLNWFTGSPPTPGDILVFDGSARFSTNNNFATNTLFDGLVFNSTAGGPFTLAGNGIDLNGNITDNSASYLNTISLNLALQSTSTINVTTFGSLAITGNIAGVAGTGITETGSGTLKLSGANTFTGPIIVSGGILSVGNDGNLGFAPAIATANTIQLAAGAELQFTGNTTVNANRGIGVGPGAANINVSLGQTVTYNGIISNNGGIGGFTKTSFGTLVLGGPNTYTGTTTDGNGILELDFTQTTAPTSNIINSTSALVMGGFNSSFAQNNYAELTINGKGSTTNSQSFASTNVNIGPALFNVLSGASGITNLSLGALTHTSGGTALFVLPATGAVTTTTSNTNGIIGGWATVFTGTSYVNGTTTIPEGSTFATVNGSHQIVGYSGYTDFGAVIGTDTGGTIPVANIHNATISGGPGGTVGASTNLRINGVSNTIINVDTDNANSITNLNTLSFSSTGTDNISIGKGNTLVLGQVGAIFKQDNTSPSWFLGGLNGVVQSGNGANTSQNVGTITAGGPTPGTPGEIVLNVSNTSETTGSLILEAQIADNNANNTVTGGAVTFIKTGAGAIKLDGHNTYSGGTYILQGRVQLSGVEIGSTGTTGGVAAANNDGFGTGPVFIFPGAYAYLFGAAYSSSIANPIANTFFISGDGDVQEALGAIRLPTNRVNLTGPATGPTAGVAITLTGNSRIGGASNAGGSGTAIAAASIVSGQITDNNAGYGIDFGSGATGLDTNVIVSNTSNNYHGDTTLVTPGSGTNTIVHAGANNVIPNGVGFGNFVFGSNSATDASPLFLDLNGTNQTVNGLSSNANVTGIMTIENLLASTASTLTVGNNDQTATYAGTIVDGAGTVAITKMGLGTETLTGANSYSGPTIINNGALSITNSLNTSGTIAVNTSVNASGALFGNGSVGAVTLADSTGSQHAAINPGVTGPGSTGTLGMTSLTVGINADLQFDLNGASADQINVGGPVTFNGASTITPSSITAGTYTVLNSSGITGPVPSLINNGNTRLTFSYDAASYTLAGGSSIMIDVSGSSANDTWTGASDGSTWDLHTTPNFTSTAPTNPNLYFDADNVFFTDTGLANPTISLGGTVQPGSVTVSNNSGTYAIIGGGSIGGGGSLTKSGNGNLTLATNNSYSGGTTLSAGRLNINNNGALGTGNFTISGGSIDNTSGQPVILSGNGAQTWNADINFLGSNSLDLGSGNVAQGNLINGANRTITVAGSTLTIGGAIADGPNGNNGLVKAGSGTLALNGPSTFSGPVSINFGTVKVGNFGALGSNTSTGTTVASGAMLDLGGFTSADVAGGFSVPLTISGTGIGGAGALINTGPSQQNAFQNGITLAADATIGGTGRIDTHNSSGLNLNNHTLTKIGTNQFSLDDVTLGAGNIQVNQGTLSLQASTSVADDGASTIVINDGATIQFASLSGTIARPFTLNGNTRINDSSPTGTTSNVASHFIMNGNVTASSNNASFLNLTGLLSGATSSLIVAGPGTLSLQNPTNTFGGGTTLNGGTLNFADIGSLGSGPLNFNGGTIQWTGGNADDISNLGITLNAGGGTFDTNGNTITLSKNISGPGGLSAIANGPLTLTGTNTYGSSTAVQTGNLIAGTAASIPAGTNVILGNATTNSGGTLDVNGFNLTIGGLNSLGVGSNTIGNGSNANDVTLTFAGTTPSNFAGTIADGLNGSSRITSLAVTGGSLILNGSGSYSGTTTVSGGTLTIGATGTLFDHNVTIGSAGTFAVALGGNIQSNTIFINNGTLNFNNPTQTITSLSSTTPGTVNLNTTILTVNSPSSFVGTIKDNGTGGGLLMSAGSTMTTDSIQTTSLETDGKIIIRSNAVPTLSKISALIIPGSYGGSASAISTWTGTLDLTNSKLIVQDTSLNRAADLAQLINQALPANTSNGTFGIVSSTATAFNVAAGKIVKVVAVVDNGVRIATFPAGSTNFGGVNNVDANSILIEATYKGDANLDGVVDIQDLTDVANHWQQAVTDWSQGDFDGSNFVDISDLTSIANNWQAGVGSSSSLSVMPSFTPPVATPEPTSLALLTLGGLLLTKRRRK